MDDNLHTEFWKGIRAMFEALKTVQTKTNPLEITHNDTRCITLSPDNLLNYSNKFPKEK